MAHPATIDMNGPSQGYPGNGKLNPFLMVAIVSPLG
jgi:hypothetical protein